MSEGFQSSPALPRLSVVCDYVRQMKRRILLLKPIYKFLIIELGLYERMEVYCSSL
jgi:hypothetical protein